MRISCVTASYVGEPLGYPGEIDWDRAMTLMAQAPILETVENLLVRLAPAKLDGIEFFFPHVSPASLTPVVAAQIRRRLAEYGMVCCACAGSIGDPVSDPYGCEVLFQTARLLHAPLIAGHMHVASITALRGMCRSFGVRVAYENGMETDARQILQGVRGGGGWIGVNLDTGNLAARGGNPARAIRELGSRIMHVHLKDVPAVGSHECVALGKGIVDVASVVHELHALGYDGWLSVEVETGDHDPTEEILQSVEEVRRLLAD